MIRAGTTHAEAFECLCRAFTILAIAAPHPEKQTMPAVYLLIGTDPKTIATVMMTATRTPPNAIRSSGSILSVVLRFRPFSSDTEEYMMLLRMRSNEPGMSMTVLSCRAASRCRKTGSFPPRFERVTRDPLVQNRRWRAVVKDARVHHVPQPVERFRGLVRGHGRPLIPGRGRGRHVLQLLTRRAVPRERHANAFRDLFRDSGRRFRDFGALSFPFHANCTGTRRARSHDFTWLFRR